MNAPERLPLPDVQSATDTRQIAIGRVGIRSIRHPLRLLAADGTPSMTVASVDMYVGLPPEQKGTHMSRFIEILECHGRELSIARVADMFDDMLERLDRYFNGTVDAWGMFQDRSGKVVKRFTVVLRGTWTGDTGVLDEDFTDSDGTRE